MAIAIMCIATGIPLLMTILIWSYHKRLNEEKLKNIFGTSYDSLSLVKVSCALYNVLTMFRKLFLSLLIAFGSDYSFSQLPLQVISSHFHFWYLIKFRPFSERLQNNLEIFNEFCILLASYHLYLLTDYVSDPHTRSTFGWSMILLTCVNLGINILLALLQTLKNGVMGVICFIKEKIMKKVKKHENLP